MPKLETVVDRTRKTTISLDKLCTIKKYLPIEEKFKFAEEYKKELANHIGDYVGYESFVAFVFFNLMVVKVYTDIELKLDYKEFDMLQENGLINKIAEFIGDDYSLLLRLVQLDAEKE